MIGSDGMPSSAKTLAGDAQHDNPLRGGVLHVEELPLADSRTAAYKIIRKAGPVARDGHGAYLVTEAEAASYVLRHPEPFSSKRASGSLGSPVSLVPVASDPPGHTRYRQVLRPFLSARGTARWLRMVRALAAELTGRFTGRGERDLVAELALPLPAVFLTLFDLPPADRGWLAARKEAVLGAAGMSSAEPPSGASVQRAAELCEYLISHIAERRRNGGADLPSRLLAETSEQRLTGEEIAGLSFLLVVAGLDTVTSALRTAFAALAARPRLRQPIAADPAVIPAAVEELLRVDGPVLTSPRVATQNAELAGQVIPADSHVAVAVAAANRDPAEHQNPHAVDFHREQRHLAFGAGPHGCLGGHLAWPEMRVVPGEGTAGSPAISRHPKPATAVSWPAGLAGTGTLSLVFPPEGGRRASDEGRD